MSNIITSLLDTDFYKFTIGQFAWKYYPDVKVKYAFINRTKDVELGNCIDIDRLIEELDNVRSLRFTFDELQYLESLGIFSRDYLSFLNKLTLPPVYVKNANGKLIIETEGTWAEAIFWETYILSIVNELYFGKKYDAHTYIPQRDVGETRLQKKIDQINKNPFNFIEFGTRRRYSKAWQEDVVVQMSMDIKNDSFLGTSNVLLAKKYMLKPIGTMAHELPMILAGLHDYNLDALKASHDKALTLWHYLYKEDLSIALTDTFGTDFFFKDFSKEKAEQWKGLRQDSGDAIDFLYKACIFYNRLGIKIKEKSIVFSDGLDINKIYEIEKEAKKNKIKTAYGWGTNLTNDLGYEPLSIVVKAVEANGRPLVKLSDNLAKSLGNHKAVEKYKKAFGYKSTYEEPTYY